MKTYLAIALATVIVWATASQTGVAASGGTVFRQAVLTADTNHQTSVTPVRWYRPYGAYYRGAYRPYYGYRYNVYRPYVPPVVVAPPGAFGYPSFAYGYYPWRYRGYYPYAYRRGYRGRYAW